MCVILDFMTSEIVDILDGRTKKVWSGYTQIIDKKELRRVRYVSIDMYEPYRSIQKLYFPDAVLICDSYHVIENINKALTKVRIRVMNRFEKDSVEYYLLKNFNFLLTKNYEDIRFNKARYNRKLGRYADFHQILDLILEIDEELSDAYALKEEYVSFNHYATQDDCRERLSKIIEEYAASYLSEFITLSGTLTSWFDEITASFASINSRRLSNGPVEGVNSKIEKIISNACGYQNFSRLRN